MELHMHSRRMEARAPDWAAAAASGFVAGAILMVLEMLWTTNLMGATPWTMSHKIAGIVMGPNVVGSHNFDLAIVAIALITHYVLGMLFGSILILAVIIARFHFDSSLGMAILVGAVSGLLLYLFNFYGMTRYFPWFIEVRGWPAIIAHLIFGMVTASMYWKLERPVMLR